MNSFTVTTTHSQASIQNQVLTLSLNRVSIVSKINTLLTKMSSSGLFSEKYQKKIEEWGKESDYQSFDRMLNDDARNDAALSLCFLLCDVIRAAMPESNLSQRLQLLDFNENLEAIIHSVLPTNKSLQMLENEYYGHVDDQYYVNEQSEFGKECYQKEEKETLYPNANKIKSVLAASFECIKKKLLEVTLKKQSMNEETDNNLTEITRKVNGLGEQLSKMAIDYQSSNEKIHRQHQHWLAVLNECTIILERM